MDEQIKKMTLNIEKYRRPLFMAGLILTSILFIWMSLNNFISHSEFWSIASGKLIGESFFNATVVYYKPLFYLILKIPFFMPLTSVDHILLVRGFFGVLATTYFFLIGLFVFRSTKSGVQSLLFLIFLLSFHTFTYNIFRVRADLLSHIFIFMAFIHVQSWPIYSSLKFRYDKKLILLILLALLCTPKAIYSLFALVFYISIRSHNDRFLKSVLSNFLVYLAIPFFVILFVAGAVQVTSFIDENPYSFALLYFFENMSQLLNPDYLIGLLQSLKINFLHYGTIFFGIFLFLKSKKNESLDFSLMGPAIVTWILFIFYPEKWDYYLASLLPLLSLPVLQIAKISLNQKFLGAGSLVVFVTPFYMTFFTGWYFPNQPQLDVVANLEELLERNPKAVYYDSTGLVPRKESLMSFISFNDSGSIVNAIEHLKARKPEIIFYTSKIHLQRSKLDDILTSSYQPYSSNIWILKNYTDRFDSRAWTEPDSPFTFLFIYDYRPKVRFFNQPQKT